MGIMFLKEVYNFIVAACAVTYSYKGDSLIMNGVKALFKFHWGSVVGSSFLLNFFFCLILSIALLRVFSDVSVVQMYAALSIDYLDLLDHKQWHLLMQ